MYAFLRGAAPESIAQSYPVLSLEEVYGAIAFYLANQDELDSAFADNDREFERLRQQTREANLGLYKKLEEARQQFQSPRKSIWESPNSLEGQLPRSARREQKGRGKLTRPQVTK